MISGLEDERLYLLTTICRGTVFSQRCIWWCGHYAGTRQPRSSELSHSTIKENADGIEFMTSTIGETVMTEKNDGGVDALYSYDLHMPSASRASQCPTTGALFRGCLGLPSTVRSDIDWSNETRAYRRG
jgi:hypothetical protein